MNRILTPFFSILLVFSSCSKKKAEKQAEVDDKIIQTYLSEKGITASKTTSGLYYFIESEGTGIECNSYSTVKVAYKGCFTNGSIFDQSATTGVTFNLQQVISGWTEGIPKFKEGGVGKLFLPSALAYGEQGTNGIPSNSVLVFDIHLIDVL